MLPKSTGKADGVLRMPSPAKPRGSGVTGIGAQSGTNRLLSLFGRSKNARLDDRGVKPHKELPRDYRELLDIDREHRHMMRSADGEEINVLQVRGCRSTLPRRRV